MRHPTDSTSAGPRLAVEGELLADGTLLLRADGDLDLETSPELALHLRGAVARELDVILDASDVVFVDSTGVAVLLNGLRRLTRRRRRLVLVASAGPVRDLLELTGMRDTFTLRPTVRAARAGLRGGLAPIPRAAD